MRDIVDQIAIDMQLRLAASYAFDWLKSIEGSSSSLTAAFYNSTYASGSLIGTLKELEKDLKIDTAPNTSVAKRLLNVRECTKAMSLSDDERWDYMVPKLEKISNCRETASKNPLRAAKALRNAVRQAG